MEIKLDERQRDQLELISVYTGRSVAELLVNTAEWLVESDRSFWESMGSQRDSQHFLDETEMDARIAQMLGR